MKIHMKKTALLSSLFISALALAQGIKFEDSNFANILAKAKKENKLVFIDAYASWCGPCKLMAKNIFPLQAVGDYYNGHFINAKIDMEKGEGVDLAKKYNVKAFPTYLFINGNGEEVHRTLGYVEEKDFIQFAKDAEDPSKRLTSLKQKFENGEKDPEFLKNLAGLTIYNDAPFAARVLERYFKDKTALDQQDVQMLLAGIQSTESPLYAIFQSKKADITKVLPAERYEMIDKNIKLNTIVKKAYDANTKKWNDTYFLAETQKFLTKDEAEKILKRAKSSRALKDKDMATYEKLSMELYKDPSAATSEELNSLAWNFFENVTNKASLEKAIIWAQESVKKQENYANTDTLANLYHKVGDNKNAKIWAEKSIQLAKASGEDYSDTEKLLKSLSIK
ncbi:thioredoxin-related protein [Chryseobacterium sp. SORGH_AS909]|uniref:Thioredoxin-related protein n=2 Tax=Chryseobacterium group TaxID=2782232 RepID=A0ABU0TIT3_9FLAO|nr:thioredoxin-related protein [Chryseobacterium camelliae]MDQ1100908.1 thioredoxin-related protein [Chryseobacterium sp. SORGH_AS_1048]MDR6084351.1 thioredoxin-related protein [Chryseobacterium sp. SORGH_AS_0909]MDR6132622.1 thioredoxin-related protein [Chryseobacterium sp. SORGH_AS_1175]MDT3409172.1 thioredoxin-related protein [Pseudacidovorax intermedius]